MRLAAVLGAAAALAVVSAPAAAQAPQQAPTYWNEISIFGTWDRVDEPADLEVTIINLRYGRMLQPQIAGTLGLSRFSIDAGGGRSTTTSLTVGAKYYFSRLGAQSLVPFAEAAIGFANTDSPGVSDSTDLTWEIGGGASFFFTDATSVDASIRLYQTSTDVRTEGTRFFLGLTTRF
jgi:hypothetical protein